MAAHEHLAALAHEAVAGHQEVRHVGGAPAPVAEHGDRVGDVHAERADERERVVIALDDPPSERRVAVRVDLAHDLDGRRGPDEAGVGGRAADRLALLDEHDARAFRGRFGRGTEPGHPRTEHEEIDVIETFVDSS